jgi:DNA-binding NtrC family response regulator
LIAVVVVVLILGLVALLRCRREDIPDIVRAIMRMGPRDDDSGKRPPSLPKP